MEQTASQPPLNYYLTINEAAEFLGVSPWTLRNWDKSGKLKPKRNPMNGYRIYSKQDLESMLQLEEPIKSSEILLPVEINEAEMTESPHFVQFYESNDVLENSVGQFIAKGLQRGEGAVIIATKNHRSGIEKKLETLGIDAEIARKTGQLICVDAEETLASIMKDGLPDSEKFKEVIGGIIADLVNQYGSACAFGEMVALLWQQDIQAGAIRLEELWNELGETYPFSLFCAYPLQLFTDVSKSESLEHIYCQHSHIVPSEYIALKTYEERLRVISELQQKAVTLRSVIENRQEHEKFLIDRERELADFFESAAEGIHKVSQDGIILWANKAELALLGYSPEEYIGHPISEFHMDAKAVADILRRLRDGENLVNYEAKLRTKSGSVRHVVLNSQTYRDENKIYSRCFTREVADQEKHQTAQAWLAAVVESSQDAILSINLEGIILSWNSSAERLYGYRAREAIGMSVNKLIPQDRHNEEYIILDRIKRGERVEHYETVRIAKNGQPINISLTVSAVRNSNGNIIALSKVARDITRQKHIEKELQEALEKANAANIAKTEFLANMSHELRTPLNAVIGIATILQTPSVPQAKQIEFAKTLQISAQQLLDLINDLLDISKLETQQMQLEHISFTVEEVIREIIDVQSVKATEKGITLINASDPCVNAAVMGDPHRFRQIMMNLVTNAIKFTEQGSVTIEVKCVDREEEVVEIQLEVKDTGIGIPPEKLDAIFNKFTQADPSFTRKYGGSGLGLTITKNLVEIMNGKIAVESVVGQGTRFCISIPFSKAPVSASEIKETATTSEPRTKLRRRVLLVEDYPANILVATTILEHLGCLYEVAKTGKEALEKIKQTNFDVALMDVQMPEMDGFQATRMLREWEAESKNPRLYVIGMTAHALKGDRERCLEAGMDDYISKPFHPDELEQKLEAAANHSLR